MSKSNDGKDLEQVEPVDKVSMGGGSDGRAAIDGTSDSNHTPPTSTAQFSDSMITDRLPLLDRASKRTKAARERMAHARAVKVAKQEGTPTRSSEADKKGSVIPKKASELPKVERSTDTTTPESKKPHKPKPQKVVPKPRATINFEGGVVPQNPALKNEPEEVIPNNKKPLVLNFALSKKQQEALNNPAKFLLYGGAKGGGKSWFMCVWIFLMAMRYRGNKLFFCRRRSVDFTNTTLETWRKSIPAQLYRINEQKKKIYIDITKSVIDFGGLDDPLVVQSLNSAEYAHIGVDQAEEVDQDSFSMLRGTLRHRVEDGSCPPYQIRLTANPAQCWLKDYFILNPEVDTAYVAALPTDNPSLPKDYVENLRQAFKHRPHLLEAYLHGSWDDLSGNDTCIRGSWIEEAKRRRVDGRPMKRVVVNDPAITGDENVCFLMEQAGNMYYKADELVIEHRRPIETAALLSSYRRKHEAQIIAVDSIGIGSGVIDQLNALEEPILAINSSAKPTSLNAQVRYANLRAQMWWEAQEKFAESKVALPPDDFELAKQLGGVRFEPGGTGKLLVQGKDEIKKAIGRSPDRADAFVMGLYALDYVSRMDQAEYENRIRDRSGYGTLVEPPEHEMYVGAGDDYSGYNL